MSRAMYDRFKDFATPGHTFDWFPDGLVVPVIDDTCAFLAEDMSCRIYKNRPKVCRIMAINKELPCPTQHIEAATNKLVSRIDRIKELVQKGEA